QVLLGATLVVLVASPWLQHLLKVESPWTLLGMVVLVLLAVPVVIWTGYLQGHSELVRIGAYNAISPLAKLLAAAALGVAGWGAVGAVLGVIIGQLVGMWVIRQIPGAELPAAATAVNKMRANELALVKPLAGYIGESVIVVGAFSGLFAIDIVMAKTFFD